MGHILFVDGQIVGGWTRTLSTRVDVRLEFLVPLTSVERELVTDAAERFGRFLELPVKVFDATPMTEKLAQPVVLRS
jgi:hypothetical protein